MLSASLNKTLPSFLPEKERERKRERERERAREREREMFYLTTHSTHFIYGYMASDIWLRTIMIVRKETCCRHIGYSYRLTARVLLYAPSHRQDNTYRGLCYTSYGALAGTEIAQWVHPMKDRSDDTSHHERTLGEMQSQTVILLLLFVFYSGKEKQKTSANCEVKDLRTGTV